MFTDPNKRQVMKESAVRFARDNHLIFIDESSAMADINVKEVLEALIEAISRVQSELIKKGIKTVHNLKISYEEEMQKETNHRCCY